MSQAVQETGSAAQKVLAASKTLDEQTASLKQSVDDFIGQVRAA